MRVAVLIASLALAFPAWADTVQLQDNVPERYVVVKGDTLWDISERFLKTPWKWPDIWQLNKDQIKDPHWIYPGDVVKLVMVNGEPRLMLEEGPRLDSTVKLSPKVSSEPLVIKEEGIPTLPPQLINPLLSRSAVGTLAEVERAPRILGSADQRVMFAKGDQVYASKGDGVTSDWRVVRLGQAIKNPNNPKEILAYELVHLGEAQTTGQGDPQVVKITSNSQEILERDKLMPAVAPVVPHYAPQAPTAKVEAKVAAALNGALYAGTWTTLVLDKGKQDGLTEGHVLALYRAGRSVADPKCVRANKIGFLTGGDAHAVDCKQDDSDKTALPDSRVGLAMVYRTFEHIAYALVMKSSEPVTIGDSARNP
jgi:hypothetical protein